jgi:hypothetical protein
MSADRSTNAGTTTPIFALSMLRLDVSFLCTATIKQLKKNAIDPNGTKPIFGRPSVFGS